MLKMVSGLTVHISSIEYFYCSVCSAHVVFIFSFYKREIWCQESDGGGGSAHLSLSDF